MLGANGKSEIVGRPLYALFHSDYRELFTTEIDMLLVEDSAWLSRHFPDNPQIQGIVPPFHRQENCIPPVATRCPDLRHPRCRRMSPFGGGLNGWTQHSNLWAEMECWI